VVKKADGLQTGKYSGRFFFGNYLIDIPENEYLG